MPSLRRIVKRCAQAISLCIVFLPAALSGFGRLSGSFLFFGQYFSLMPGRIGDSLRSAFYRCTLDNCSQDTVISFGTYFSRPQVTVEPNVSIGSYCVIGRARIGRRTQIASHVQIPGSRTQHLRDSSGRLSSTIEDPNAYVTIGEDCWIGASAVVMANVGSQSTIGAGSVVVKNIPAGVVAVGSPARVIKEGQA